MMAETFDCVTVFYGEIVAFDKLISDCNADEVGGQGFCVVGQIWVTNSPTHLVFGVRGTWRGIFGIWILNIAPCFSFSSGLGLHQHVPWGPGLPHKEISGGLKIKMIVTFWCGRCTTHRPWRTRSWWCLGCRSELVREDSPKIVLYLIASSETLLFIVVLWGLSDISYPRWLPCLRNRPHGTWPLGRGRRLSGDERWHEND